MLRNELGNIVDLLRRHEEKVFQQHFGTFTESNNLCPIVFSGGYGL
jgi:hypothetical protein